MLTKWQVPVIPQDMRDNRQIFVDWLKHAVRIEGKMKAGRLAKKAGVDPGTISKYLNGHSLPRDVADMIKICKVLEADYEQIIVNGRLEDGQIEKVEIPTATVKVQAGEATVPEPYDKVYKEHIKIVKQFPNREMALEANKILLEINQVSGAKGMARAMAAMADILDAEKQQETPDQGKLQKNGTTDQP